MKVSRKSAQKAALFVGRFQPLHRGHLFAIKAAMKKFDELIIVVGSTNRRDAQNPFSFRERKEMIARARIKCEVIGVPDVFDDKRWRESILSKVDFDVVISGSDRVKRCFKGVKKVIEPDMLEPEKYNGTRIREKIRKGKRWEHLVPAEVAKYIKEIGGEDRIRRLME